MSSDLVQTIIEAVISSEEFAEAIKEQSQGLEIEADNVTGLEDYITGITDTIEVEANSVNGPQDYIDNALDNYEIEADSVKGLNEMVSAAIEGELDNRVADAVEDAIGNQLHGAVQEEIASTEAVQVALANYFLITSEGKESPGRIALKNLIREVVREELGLSIKTPDEVVRDKLIDDGVIKD